jgi:hypothetical protein
MHALHSGQDGKSYAEKVGRARGTVRNEIYAARVAAAVSDVGHATERFAQLVEIHAAPGWLWPALVAAMLGKGWNVEATRAAVARLKDVTADPPAWLAGRVAEAVADIGYDHSSHFGLPMPSQTSATAHFRSTRG